MPQKVLSSMAYSQIWLLVIEQSRIILGCHVVKSHPIFFFLLKATLFFILF